MLFPLPFFPFMKLGNILIQFSSFCIVNILPSYSSWKGTNGECLELKKGHAFFFLEACGPKLISIRFIPSFCVCVCYSMAILTGVVTGAESTWCYIGKEMEKQVTRQRINFIAGHLVPTDDLSITLIFLYGDAILPLFVGKWKKN